MTPAVPMITPIQIAENVAAAASALRIRSKPTMIDTEANAELAANEQNVGESK